MSNAPTTVETNCEAHAMPRSPVPILTYHSLDESRSVISLSPAIFRQQMEQLHAWGFEGITLGHLLSCWDRGDALPAKPVVLTFDDAFGNFAEHAQPVLTRFKFSATLFAVAEYCGGKNDWPSQPPGVPRMPLLSFASLRQLADNGFEIGAHTMTHPHLPTLSPSRRDWEIATAREILQDQLGHAVSTFAYPYGEADVASRVTVAGLYRGACGVRLGWSRASSDRFELPRLDMYYYRRSPVFCLFPRTVGSLYLQLRRLGCAVRRGLHRSTTAHQSTTELP